MTTLKRWADWCRSRPADALATAAFATLLLGIGMLSIPWALIVGGGTVFLSLALTRILGGA